MYTTPDEHFLRRQCNEDSLLTELSDLLDEIVNFGSNVLGWYQPKGDAGFVPLGMLRKAVDNVDGISILLRNHSIDPARTILRSFVQNYVHLYFILTGGDKGFQYALNYSYCRTAESKRAWIKERDRFIKLNRPEAQKRVDICNQGVKNCEQVMSNDNYCQSKQEHARLTKIKKNSRRKFSWFTMHHPNQKQPTTLRDLAKYLDLDNEYEDWFAPLSSAIHADDVIDDTCQTIGDPPTSYTVKPIRLYNPLAATNMTLMIIEKMLFLYSNMIGLFVGERHDEFKEWSLKIEKHRTELKNRQNDLHISVGLGF